MNLTTRLYIAMISPAEYHSKTGLTRMNLVTLKK
jgi:hypothetical protein